MTTFGECGVECSTDLAGAVPRKVLWGIAPTGVVHLGYVATFHLLRRLQGKGASAVVLLANYHGYLDGEKTAWAEIERKSTDYKRWCSLAGCPVTIETRDLYLTPEYTAALYEMSSHLPLSGTLEAGRTTLRHAEGCHTVADALYIATQVLDVKFLNADAVVCGQDEADIYRFGLPLLEAVYGRSVTTLFLPMCPGLVESEMHSSDSPENKIEVSDPPSLVKDKLRLHMRRSAGVPPLARYACATLFPIAGLQPVADSLAVALAERRRDAAEDLILEGVNTLLEPWQ